VNLIEFKQESSRDIKAALDWIINNAATYNIQVINLTDFVTDVEPDAADPTVYNWELQQIHDMGIYIGTPVGNGAATYGDNLPIDYPALSPYVVGVGGVNQQGQFYADSRRGNGLDVLAPAENVTLSYYIKNPNSTGFDAEDDNYDGTAAIVPYAVGTSWASAYTSGVAALIKQVNQSITPDQILQIMQQSGTPVTDPSSGISYPMINVDAAVRLAEQMYGTGASATA
jgi:hypothetical protein